MSEVPVGTVRYFLDEWGNGSWGNGEQQSVKDRWVCEIRRDDRRYELLRPRAV